MIPDTPETFDLALKAYKRSLYLQAEGFTEEEAYAVIAQEYGL